MPSGFWAYFIKTADLPPASGLFFEARGVYARPGSKNKPCLPTGKYLLFTKMHPQRCRRHVARRPAPPPAPPWGVAAVLGEEREEEIQAEDLFVCFPRRFSTATYSARMAGARRQARRRARAKEAPAAIWVAKRKRPCRPPCRCGKTRPRGRPWRQSPGDRKGPADP